MLFGVIPVAILGLVFFAGMLVLQAPRAWRSTFPGLSLLRLASVTGGIGFVAYLVYTELVTLDTICMWCTFVHALTFLIFVVTILGSALAFPLLDTSEDAPDTEAPV
jgi:uncharacterized membrane protein